MKTLIKSWGILNNLAKHIVMIAGTLLIILLCMWSVVFLKGGSVDKAQLNLEPLISSLELAWIWIGTLIIFVIGAVVWLIQEVQKGIAKARDNKLSAEEKTQSLFWWILKH